MIASNDKTPLATKVETVDGYLIVHLAAGAPVRLPISHFPRLSAATPAQRNDYRFIGKGQGIHWPQLDEDLLVSALISASAR